MHDIIHAFYGTDGTSIAAQYNDGRIVWHALASEEGQDLRKLILPPMSINTEAGPRRLGGPITHLRAAPVCIALSQDYVRHTNAWRETFNAGRTSAFTEQMRTAAEWPTLAHPDWADPIKAGTPSRRLIGHLV